MTTAMISGLLAAMLVAASVPVTAAERERNGVNQRQHHQQQRIQQGVRQGDLTRGEARELRGQARNIHRERNDGQRRYVRAGPRPDHGWRGNHYGWQGSTRAFDRRVDLVQRDQRRRIEQGMRSGALTRHEASRLLAQQRAIEVEEQRYLADGIVTRAERTDLLQDLNAVARRIYNESHDAQARR